MVDNDEQDRAAGVQRLGVSCAGCDPQDRRDCALHQLLRHRPVEA